jgi:ureidoglycolate lyase
MSDIVIEPISAAAFAPFGDLLSVEGDPDRIINQGLCGRFHDRARLDFTGGRAGISLFHAELRRLPMALEMMERHPLGAQAFVPMDDAPFLVIVAPDEAGRPGTPRAFVTTAHQAVNYHRGTWHGVLTPIAGAGIFAVVDRIAAPGDADPNLEEHWFDTPWRIVRDG